MPKNEPGEIDNTISQLSYLKTLQLITASSLKACHIYQLDGNILRYVPLLTD